MDGLMAQIEDRDKTIQRLEATLKEYEAIGEVISESEADILDGPNFYKNPITLQNKVRDIIAERDEVQEEKDELENENYNYEQRIEELEEERDELEEDKEILKDKVEGLEAMAEGLKAMTEDMKKDHATEKAELLESMGPAQEVIKILRAEKEVNQRNLAKVMKANHSLKAEIDTLTKTDVMGVDKKDIFDHLDKKMAADLMNAEKRADRAKAVADGLAAEVFALSDKVKALQKELSECVDCVD